MRVAIIIVCMFYILFGGYHYRYTGMHGLNYSTFRLVKSNLKFTDNKQGVSVVKAVNPDEPGDNFFSDLEDEDSNDSTARKNKLLARGLYTLGASFVLTYLFSRFRSSKPYYSLFAFKYITQRVLRIWWTFIRDPGNRSRPFLLTFVFYIPPALQVRSCPGATDNSLANSIASPT